MKLAFWKREAERDHPLSLDEFAKYFSYNNLQYPFVGLNQTIKGDRESIAGDFAGLVAGAYRQNGVIFACMLVRLLLFSEARFQFRQMRSGRPGELFGNSTLELLERPWPGGTTGDLLTRAIQDADIAGNFFCTRRPGGTIRRLRPDWVDIVLGSESEDVQAGDIDAEVLGYVYHPGGRQSRREPDYLLREEVAHFAPIPDPLATYRGMSWLTPVIREVISDKAAVEHKIKFWENGATPNMVVGTGLTDRTKFDEFVKKFRESHEGAENAYKTLFLGQGMDATVVGADFKQMDFKVVQGHGETRIAAAAGVPPVIVGLSEGLAAATYSNYGQARRRLADGTMRPLWRNMASSLATLIDVPSGAELWYDDRDIPFLQEDVKDAADIQHVQAQSIRALVDAGFDHATVVEAVVSGDLRRLKHTGLFSVQLRPPGAEAPATNGSEPSGRASDDTLAEILERWRREREASVRDS